MTDQRTLKSAQAGDVCLYARKHLAAWNKLVDEAPNGHFSFKRGYVEYHSDRFIDHSLVIIRDGRIKGVFPANRRDDTVYSHQGLTYGGLLLANPGGVAVIAAFDLVVTRLRREGVCKLVYKPVPYVYQKWPADDDLYAIHRLGGRLVRRELSSALYIPSFGQRLSAGKKDNLRKAARAGLQFVREISVEPFMGLLYDALTSRHSVEPTHSAAEIELLRDRFPANIRLFGAVRQGRLVAGAVVFINGSTIHTQYLASNDEGRSAGAIDFVVERLILEEFSGFRWLSFGISTEDGGRRLNAGLLHSKESFGAGGINHDTYEIDL